MGTAETEMVVLAVVHVRSRPELVTFRIAHRHFSLQLCIESNYESCPTQEGEY